MPWTERANFWPNSAGVFGFFRIFVNGSQISIFCSGLRFFRDPKKQGVSIFLVFFSTSRAANEKKKYLRQKGIFSLFFHFFDPPRAKKDFFAPKRTCFGLQLVKKIHFSKIFSHVDNFITSKTTASNEFFHHLTIFMQDDELWTKSRNFLKKQHQTTFSTHVRHHATWSQDRHLVISRPSDDTT